MNLGRYLFTLYLMLGLTTLVQADWFADHKAELEQEFSEENMHHLLDAVLLLKENGASFQSSLLAPTNSVRDYRDEQRQIMIGVYQLDALYAAAFHRKREASASLSAQSALLQRMDLRNQLSLSVIFPVKIKEMLTDQERLEAEAIIDAFSESMDNYHVLMNQTVGFKFVEASIYGLVIEGFYVFGQSLVMQPELDDMDRLINAKTTLPNREQSASSIVDALEKGINMLLTLYHSFDQDERAYINLANPNNPNQRLERLAQLETFSEQIQHLRTEPTIDTVITFEHTITQARNAIVNP